MATKEEYIKALNGMEEVYDNLDGCMSAINIFKEGVNLLTGLINEHFEEEETNAEHYLNDLLKIGMNFCFMHGKVKNCCDVGCAFFTFGKANCDKERFKWLASPYKKPPYKLTKFENDLLQSYLKGHLSGRKFKSILVLNWMKEKGYFKDIDENATIVDILEKCEVI
ncbi:hypothetical protein [Holdemanella biformis]|uniref:hypothetical protein n=1 Tax=Holdemanella biformis TaxID=1735 RepID=UPI00266551A8|nr:hypothetical protein [Holdemanella biformis]